MWTLVRTGLMIVAGVACLVALAIGAFIIAFAPDNAEQLKARLFAKYDDLLPREFRGAYVADFERRDRKYTYCASHEYMVSEAQVAAFLARIKPDMKFDKVHRPTVPRAFYWRVAPVAGGRRPREDRCGDARFRKEVDNLLIGDGYIYYLEQGRTGFGNFDARPETFFEFLVVVDHRSNRVYTSFWDREQGG
jgi:hypothetical protein